MTYVLVTGGAGFIGSHIVDRVLQEGYMPVILDNLSTGKIANINPRAIFYKGNICDKKILVKLFKHYRFKYVFHQAAHASVPESIKDPIYDMQQNIHGSLCLMEVAKEYKVKKFIFASTGGALYGDKKNTKATEEDRALPISPYGVAKLSTEKYLYYYGITFNLNYVALRYSNVYGPRQDPYGEAGVVAIFSNLVKNNKAVIVNGSGNNTRDYIYIDDIVEANIRAMKSKKGKAAYNIATEKETSVNEIVKMLKEISQKNIIVKHGPAKSEQKKTRLSARKAKKELAWQARVDFFTGLKKTYEWFKQN